MYAIADSAIHHTTTPKTVMLVFKRKMVRPAKKRKREMCIMTLNHSTANITGKPLTAPEKKARNRSSLCGLYRSC